jgi:rhodanese-related sulfurtransferase/predicted MFS family arabinose efflux permease
VNDSSALFVPRVRERVYYGWIVLGVAALAMVGTLPGRTQGLGLITEPLLRDLGLSRVTFAQINLVATLIGALFCLGVGRLIDRAGSRVVLTVTSVALGLTVIAMSQVSAAPGVLVLVTLTRGFGQSALSVVSLAMVGKWFRRRLTVAMAVYALVMSIGFMVAFPLVGAVVQSAGWRIAWAAIGATLLVGLAPLAWWLDRSSPESIGLSLDGDSSALAVEEAEEHSGGPQARLGEALRSPAFWVFALASSVYGLVASGIGLLNESILAERGFAPDVYYTALAVTAITGLAGNFAAGALAPRVSLRVILVTAMIVLAAALAALAHVSNERQVMVQAVAMGIAGGFITVVFFSFWAQAYGRLHLGRIQGAAQALTVVASAIGPLFLAVWVERTGSYAAAFYVLAVIVTALGVAAALVSLPPGAEPARHGRAEISAQALLEQIETKRAPTIIDVRTSMEFSQGHVPGSINIPFQSIGAHLDMIPGSRRDAVVVYCGHGPRARIAGAVLRKNGFTSITYLAGHFSKWKAADLRQER